MPSQLLTVAPYPFIVWGADETRCFLLRRHRHPGGIKISSMAQQPVP